VTLSCPPTWNVSGTRPDVPAAGVSGERGAKLLDRNPGGADELAQRPRRELTMIGDRERRDGADFGEDHVAAGLLVEHPPEPLEGSARIPSLATGRSGNGDVDLDRSNGEWQSLLGPNLEASDDRLADVRERLLLRLSLTHTPRDRRAFGNDHAALVAFEGHGELHG